MTGYCQEFAILTPQMPYNCHLTGRYHVEAVAGDNIEIQRPINVFIVQRANISQLTIKKVNMTRLRAAKRVLQGHMHLRFGILPIWRYLSTRQRNHMQEHHQRLQSGSLTKTHCLLVLTLYVPRQMTWESPRIVNS